MNNKTRDLIHKCLNENLKLLPLMHQLTSYRDIDRILNWLIMNNLTGKNLEEWIKGNFENSVMSMVKWIIMHQNKEKDYRPIIYGRDWIE